MCVCVCVSECVYECVCVCVCVCSEMKFLTLWSQGTTPQILKLEFLMQTWSPKQKSKYNKLITIHIYIDIFYFLLNLFWTEMSVIYSQLIVDYYVISSYLVHNIWRFIVKHTQWFKGPLRKKFRTRSTKTELNVRTIMDHRPFELALMEIRKGVNINFTDPERFIFMYIVFTLIPFLSWHFPLSSQRCRVWGKILPVLNRWEPIGYFLKTIYKNKKNSTSWPQSEFMFLYGSQNKQRLF